MGLVDAVKSGFRKYVTWNGRAARSEYWFFVLAEFIALIVAMLIDSVLGTRVGASGPGIIYTLVALAFLLPSISVAVRRLHDTNRSGWWYWIGLVPLIGFIVLLVFFCTRGTIGPNRFGADPLGESTEDVFE